MLKSQNDQDLSRKFSFSEIETHLNDSMMKPIWFSERLNIQTSETEYWIETLKYSLLCVNRNHGVQAPRAGRAGVFSQ